MDGQGLILPQGYAAELDIRETQRAIKYIKDNFQRNFASALKLERVSAPLFVPSGSGLNDDLNGVERAVRFDVAGIGGDAEIVHSLAKWKRMALADYAFTPGTGLYTDMNAIRRDETLDNLHSVYVDQWDWEMIINKRDRSLNTLKRVVSTIMRELIRTVKQVSAEFSIVEGKIEPNIFFITTQELEDRWPDMTPREREDEICRERGTVCLLQIGDTLKSGVRHDGRAPDYDDWTMNCDILLWNELLQRAFEISSMGIRVDETALVRQLKAAGCPERAELPFHKRLLAGELPYTIGGGIGQSRLCMLMLSKAHIGEVQASVWPREMKKTCAEHGIYLL